MVTTQQARTQLNQARQQVQQERTKSQEQQKRIEEAKKKLPNVTSQRELRKSSNPRGRIKTGLQQREERRKVKSKKEMLSREIEKLKKYQDNLKDYETNQLATYEKQIQQVEQQQARNESLISAINEYVQGGTESSFDADELRKKYGDSIYYEAKSYVEQNKTRDVADFQVPEITTTIQPPEVLSGVTSQTKSIYFDDTKKKEGVTNVSSISNGLSGGESSGVGFIPSVRNFVSDFIGGSSKGIKEEISKSPSFVSAYEGEVKSIDKPDTSTFKKIISTPSIALVSARDYSAQQSALVGAESLLGIGGVGSVGGKEVFDISNLNRNERNKISNYETNITNLNREYQELKNYEIPKFEQEHNMNDLSKNEMKQYNQLVEQANKKADLYNKERTNYQNYLQNQGSAKFGYFNYETSVPRTELTSPMGYFNAQIGAITGGAGYYTGKAYDKITQNQLPKFNSLFWKEPTVPDAVYDFNTGIARVGTKEDLPSPTTTPDLFVQGSDVQKVTTLGLDVGKYFVPYAGNVFFASEIGEDLSQVGYSPKRFVKEKPMDVLVLGTIGGLKASPYIFKGARGTFRGIGKLSDRMVDDAINSRYVFSSTSPMQLLAKQKNKFAELEETLGNLAKRLDESKASPREQKRILEDFKDYYKVSDENYKKILEKLKDKNILTSNVVKIDATKEGIYFNTLGFKTQQPSKLDVKLPLFDTQVKTNIKEINWIGEGIKETPKQDTKQKNILGFKFKQDTLQKFKQLELLKTSQRTKQDTKEASLLKSFLNTALTQREKQALKQKARQISKTTQRTKPKEKAKLKPKIKIPFSSGGKSKTAKKKDVFEIFSRRFGKEISLGSFGTKKEAESVLKKYIFGGLARSGKVKKGEDILDINLGAGFRPAKSLGKGWSVQKNPLQFGSEKSEIQMWKKRADKKKKSKSNKLKWFS